MDTFFAIISLAAAVISFFMGTLVLFRNRRGYLNIVFFILCLTAAYWSFTEFQYRGADTIETARFWLRFNALWPLTGALVLHFALIYTEQWRLLRNPLTFVVLYAPMLIFSVLNFASQPYLEDPVKEYWGWTFLGPSPVSYYLAELLVAIFAIIAVSVCFTYHLKQPRGALKTQTGLVTVGLSIPLVLGVLSDINFPGLETLLPELAATSFAVGSSTFIGYAIWRYELFAITPSTVAEEIIGTMSDALLLIDADCRIIFSNQAAREMLGYTKGKLTGLSIDEILASEANKAECHDLLKDNSVTGVSAIESAMLSARGAEIPVLLSLSIIRDIHGDLRGFICVAHDITRSKQDEAALRESESRYRTLFEISPYGIALVDLDGTVLMCNQMVADLTGYDSPGEVIGKKNADFIVPEDRQRMTAARPEVFDHGVRNIEFTIQRPDGSLHPVEVSVSPVLDEHGIPEATITVINDIAKRKHDELALRQSEERLKAQYRSMPVPTYTWQRVGDDFTLVSCNDAAVVQSRGQVTKSLGAKASELYADDPDIPRDLEACFNSKKQITREMTYSYRYEDKKRARNIFATFAYVPPDQVLVHAEDITERKRMVEALRISEERYRGLVEASPDAVSLTRIDGQIIFCNHQLSEMLGYGDPDELIGLKFDDLVSREDRAILHDSANLLSNDRPGTTVFSLVKKDDNHFPAEVRGSLINDAEGKPYAIITVIRDITERQQTETRLSRQSAELAERNLELEALYNVSQSAATAKTTEQLVSRVLKSMSQLRSIFNALPKVGFFLIDGERLTLAGDIGGHTKSFREMHRDLRVGQCLCGLAAQTGEVLISENSDLDSRHTIQDADQDDHGHIIVPLKTMDKVFGVIYLYLPAGAVKISERRLRLLESIGIRIGTSLENIQLHEQTRELSLHDPLTGLANRRLMEMELDKSMARSKRTGIPFSLIMFDLDYFKNFNDLYGHTSGDKLLIDIAELVNREIRQVDLAVRYGGEEFLLVLSDTDSARAIEVAERIRVLVDRSRFLLPGQRQTAHMTISLGVSTYEESTAQPDFLIARADTALYLAKNNGRNRVEAWLPGTKTLV